MNAPPLVRLLLCAWLMACGSPPGRERTEGTVLMPPTGLTASRDDSQAVVLRFQPPAAAPDGYVVLRDGEEIANLDGVTFEFRDPDASAGHLDTVELSASQGTRSDGVEVTWLPPRPWPGADHQYQVLASYGDLRSEPSSAAVGARAAPALQRYDVCKEPCSAWWPAGSALNYLDREAPLSRIDAGRALAVAHTVPEGAVSLVNARAEVTPMRAEYRVRVIAEDGEGDPSLPASGFRKAAEPQYQWQRSSDGRDESFSDLSDVTGVSWIDATAPSDADVHYRARVFAEGAEPTFSAPALVHTRPVATQVVIGNIGCVLYDEGKVHCWGPAAVANAPLSAPKDLRVSELRIGGDFVCGLEIGSGHLHCWTIPGAGDDGPDEYLVSEVSYRALVTTDTLACAIRNEDQRIRCFNRKGYESEPFPDAAYRDLSSSRCAIRASDDVLVCLQGGRQVLQGETFRELSHGSDCAIRKSDGLAICWDPANGRAVSPVPVHSPVASFSGNCGLTVADGEPICWSKTGAISLLVPGRNYQMITGYGTDFCLLTEEGRVRCTGSNWYGVAPSLPSSEPLAATSGYCGLDAKGAIHCQTASTFQSELDALPDRIGFTMLDGWCALNAEGEAQCWSGTQDGTPPDLLFSVVRTYNSGACGLLKDTGAALCWGSRASYGGDLFLEPTGSGYRDISLGYAGTVCLLDANDKLECFGPDAYSAVPAGPSTASYSAISTGSGGCTCALRKDDAGLDCWGAVTNDITPPLGRFSAVSVGSIHACAIQESDGRIRCWGEGKLPDGITRASYVQLDAFSESTCAIRAGDNKRVCWGRSFLGEGGALLVTP